MDGAKVAWGVLTVGWAYCLFLFWHVHGGLRAAGVTWRQVLTAVWLRLHNYLTVQYVVTVARVLRLTGRGAYVVCSNCGNQVYALNMKNHWYNWCANRQEAE